MEIINCDILKLRSGLICHQVNNRGVMGAGLAKKIAKRWPAVKDDYLLRHKMTGGLKLGDCISTMTHEIPPHYVVSLVAQDGYGTDRCYTDYVAVARCLNIVKALQKTLGLKIFMPYKIGCGLGGGDWAKVSALIDEIIPETIICRLSDEQI